MKSAFGELDNSLAPVCRVAEEMLGLVEQDPSCFSGSAHVAVARVFELIDAWLYEEGKLRTVGEDTMVQGAGSLLAIAFAKQWPGAVIVRRDGKTVMRLGSYGWCDTYDIVRNVLEANEPRQAFAELLRRVEAEAEGRSVLAAAKRVFETELQRRYPEVQVVEQGSTDLRLSNGMTVDIARILRAVDGEEESQLIFAVNKLIDVVGAANGPSDLVVADARRRLLPRLVPADFFDNGAVDNKDVVATFLGAGVCLSYVLSFGDRARFVSKKEQARWGLSDYSMFEQALRNLEAKSARMRLSHLSLEQGPMLMAHSGDGLDAARILLPKLHCLARRELGDDLCFALPHRDVLLITRAYGPSLTAAVAHRAAEACARAPHRIASNLFLLKFLKNAPPHFEAIRPMIE